MLIAHILAQKGSVVHSIAADATLEEAARELNARRVGAMVILGEDGAVAGVLSERDIVREIAKRGHVALQDRVSSAMTRAVITCSARETLDEALTRMSGRRIRHLPVVDGVQLVGVVSIGDLVARKIEKAEAEAAMMHAYISGNLDQGFANTGNDI